MSLKGHFREACLDGSFKWVGLRPWIDLKLQHYWDVIMGAMASQITSLTIVYSTVYSAENQRKHQSTASVAFVRGIHRWPVNSPHKGPKTRKMFPFEDVIVNARCRIRATDNDSKCPRSRRYPYVEIVAQKAIRNAMCCNFSGVLIVEILGNTVWCVNQTMHWMNSHQLPMSFFIFMSNK